MAWPWPINGVSVVNALAVSRDVEVVRDNRFADGRRGLLDVYMPKAAHDAPLVVFLYGGGWEDGARADYRFAAMALARRGIVTMVPDYRLYPDVRFPDFIADGARAVRWARRNAIEFGADPRLLFLVGHSAGAYIAAMLTLERRWLDGDSMAALCGTVGMAGPYDFLPLDTDTTVKVFGEAPDLARTQPVDAVGPLSPPAFLATGDADTTVRPRHTAGLATRLRAVRVPVQERTYVGLDHKDTLLALSVTFRSKAPELAEMAAFLMRHAGGRTQVTMRR